jgi:hypothetical protein
VELVHSFVRANEEDRPALQDLAELSPESAQNESRISKWGRRQCVGASMTEMRARPPILVRSPSDV